MRDGKLLVLAFATTLLLIQHYHCETVGKLVSDEERNIEDGATEYEAMRADEKYINDEMKIRIPEPVSSAKLSVHESDNDEERKQVAVKDKRGGGIFIIPLIAAAVVVGATLLGTTVASLVQPGYSITASGSIENFSRWTMFYQHCTPRSGHINHPMVTVAPGLREGFASHKAGGFKGTWVYCQYKVHGKYVHIMYTIPYSHHWHSNWMALGISEDGGSKWNAYNMYWYNYKGMDKKKYYHSITPTKVCRYGMCIQGTMGTSYKAIIDIKLYPQSYQNLSPTVRKKLEIKDHVDHYEAMKQYQAFIREEFH